jgi:hypothetical protein
MEYFLGGVLFALFIAAQALALVAMRPVSMQKQSETQPDDRQTAKSMPRSPGIGSDGISSVRGRRLLQP